MSCAAVRLRLGLHQPGLHVGDVGRAVAEHDAPPPTAGAVGDLQAGRSPVAVDRGDGSPRSAITGGFRSGPIGTALIQAAATGQRLLAFQPRKACVLLQPAGRDQEAAVAVDQVGASGRVDDQQAAQVGGGRVGPRHRQHGAVGEPVADQQQALRRGAGAESAGVRCRPTTIRVTRPPLAAGSESGASGMPSGSPSGTVARLCAEASTSFGAVRVGDQQRRSV